MYFPDDVPAPQPVQDRPQDLHRLVESRYTSDLLNALATCWHGAWHRRARESGASDVHALADWSRAEVEVWGLVRMVAEHGYDWRVRQRLVNRCSELLGEEHLRSVSFRAHEKALATRSATRRSQATSPAVEREARGQRALADSRMHELAESLRERAAPDFGEWMRTMRDYRPHDQRTVSAAHKIDICESHAAVWESLSDWMLIADGRGGPTDGRDDLREAFGNAVSSTSSAWARAITAKAHPRGLAWLRALLLSGAAAVRLSAGAARGTAALDRGCRTGGVRRHTTSGSARARPR
jgi:hypothetical protein